jgi:uncharacterized protein DUF3854
VTESTIPRLYPDNLLARHHEAKLAAGRIAPEIAAVRGYLTVTEETILARFHFASAQRRFPGLFIPIYPVVSSVSWASDGTPISEFAIYRPDAPRLQASRQNSGPARYRKYEQAAGARNCLDCLPSRRELLADPAIDLVITEGILKEDAITSAAIRDAVACVVISVEGVFSWRGKNAFGGLEAVADWEKVALNGRRIAIVFDSDAWRNPSVHAALRRLKAFLETRGAIVAVVYLPDLADGTS